MSLAQAKGKQTQHTKSRRTASKRKGRTQKQKNTETSLLRYEILGIILICSGIFMSVSIVGVDTGSAGHSLDNILSYIFGSGRILFTLALISLGLK